MSWKNALTGLDVGPKLTNNNYLSNLDYADDICLIGYIAWKDAIDDRDSGKQRQKDWTIYEMNM